MKLLPIMLTFRVGDPRISPGLPVVHHSCERCGHAVAVSLESDTVRQERKLELICTHCLSDEEARKLGGMYVTQSQADEAGKYLAGQN